MAKRIAGTCFIKVDGTQLEVKGNIGGTKWRGRLQRNR